MKMKVYEDHFA